MTFPTIEYCIVCEQVRLEAQNKLTIMGFFGITPTVVLLTSDIEQAAPVMFLLGTSQVLQKAKHKARYILLNPDGSNLDQTDVDLILDHQGGKAVVGYLFQNPFIFEGKHTFLFVVDGVEKFRDTFEVRRMAR